MKYFDVDSIYFGNLVYNTGNDGYYHTGTELFEKIDDDLYKPINRKAKVNVYTPKTTKYLTVNNLYPLKDFINDNTKKEISSSKLKLYLIKYCLSQSDKNSTLTNTQKKNR